MRLPAAVLAFALSAGGAMAQDEPGIRWGAVLDLRAARSGTSASWLSGGLGKTRYGEGRVTAFESNVTASVIAVWSLGAEIVVRALATVALTIGDRNQA